MDKIIAKLINTYYQMQNKNTLFWNYFPYNTDQATQLYRILPTFL